MLFQYINGLLFSLLLPCSDIFFNRAIRAVGCTAQYLAKNSLINQYPKELP